VAPICTIGIIGSRVRDGVVGLIGVHWVRGL